MEKYQYHTIYEIKNLINGKIYVGAHSTYNVNDCYMGSGKLIKQAIEKHGSENFIKTIICFCGTCDEMFKREAEIVNEEFVKREDTYNLRVGGEGFSLGHITSEETKKKISKAITGIKRSAESIEKMRTSATGRTLSDEAKEKVREFNKGKVFSEGSRQKISVSKKGIKRPKHVTDALKKANTGRQTWNKGVKGGHIDPISGLFIPTGKKVMCSVTGKIYDSVVEAARQLGFNRATISKYCKRNLHGWSYFVEKECVPASTTTITTIRRTKK